MKISTSSVLAMVLWVSTTLGATAQNTDPKILHIINRLSFGPRAGDVERVQSIGIDRYIQEQLNPSSSLPAALQQKLAQFKFQSLTPNQLAIEYGATLPAAERQAKRKDSNRILAEATQAKLIRAIDSPNQLEEVMTDFWFNHFNVAGSKGIARVWVGNYENTAIRPHVFGKFQDLLVATAKHPAMLHYLDNQSNSASNNPQAKKGLNENYARELMELHTLGVKGGYSQKDVTSLARILTGWGYRSYNAKQNNIDTAFSFFFNPKRHDSGSKVFLGKTIAGSGETEVMEALFLLAKSPATAKHLSYQLAQYFVKDDPPASLVSKLQQRWLATDGDIRSVLDTLFHSREFWSASRAKFKTPLQYVVSTLRISGLEVTNAEPVARQLQQMGMQIYNCPTPDGYSNTSSTWLSSNALSQRLDYASTLSSGRLKIGSSQPKPVAIDSGILGQTISPFLSKDTRDKIAKSQPNLQATLMLGSPDFMYR
jgi:uncharacterized protein (DUF1800 family)